LDATDATHSATAAAAATPPARPLSVEITPDEFDYYMKRAQQMRAEAMTAVVGRWFAALARLFARAKPAPLRREPALMKPIRRQALPSRTA
jgi:hypothetical protein